MCCFSPVAAAPSFLARLFSKRPELSVSETSLFARMEGSGEQVLVYSMKLTVAGDVAMVLPLPVVTGLGDGALTFVDLQAHAGFFADLEALFAMMEPLAKGGSGLRQSRSQPKLVVHEVGAFEASYVPTRRDFSRLDERFRIPDAVWDGLGRYDDFGFAVFRLAPGKKKHIHPMAFRFRTRDPSQLFFPTVHVHDGKVHPTADFDHTLYYQDTGLDPTGPRRDDVAGDPVSAMTAVKDFKGLVRAGEYVAKRTLHGDLPNVDTRVPLRASD